MPKPFCTTSVSTPNPTSADSSVVSAALNAITAERNAIASSRNVIPMM